MLTVRDRNHWRYYVTGQTHSKLINKSYFGQKYMRLGFSLTHVIKKSIVTTLFILAICKANIEDSLA